jgi:hypothetical protein
MLVKTKKDYSFNGITISLSLEYIMAAYAIELQKVFLSCHC